jgi:DHA1 family bicyclomycin/chloramphenicol resistance-like MFS transporter
MPDIARSLHVNIEKIEITISIFLISFALGQLFGGVFSDRYGRKKIALIGLSLFTLANFLLYFSSSLQELYIYRAIQAFSGGLAIVNSSAMVRDIFHGKEAAKAFSTIASITMLAPMIAPSLGALIISYFRWNYIFLFLGIYSLLVTFTLWLNLIETGTPTKSKILEAYKRVLTNRDSLGFIIALSLGFSGMFIFIEKSSFIYIEYFGVSKQLFPFLFGLNVLVMILLTRYNIKLVEQFEPKNILKVVLIIQFIAGIILSFIASTFPNLIAVTFFITIYVGILGIIFGNGIATALEYFKHDSGIANSVIGVTEFTIAGFIGFLTSLIHTKELMPIFIMMSFTSLFALLALKIKSK